MEEERTTYRAIREWAIESAYDTCRSSIAMSQKNGSNFVDNSDLFGAFFSETHECFETDLEELMWRTFELVIHRGLGPRIARAECTRIITDILARQSFDELAKQMSDEEAKELRYDLKLLKFIE